MQYSTLPNQINFLKSRGVDFVIFDWYGSSSYENTVCLAWKPLCEKLGMNFAFCFDAGLFAHQPANVDCTDYMKQQFQYVLTTYGSSPNHEKTTAGKLLAIEFGWEGKVNLAAGHTHFDPAFIMTSFPQFVMCWENSGGYGQPGSSGAFAWVGNNPANVEGCVEAYNTGFLQEATKHPNAITIGSLCKGFDDHNRRPGGNPADSCWGGPARFVDEKQGQTLLNVIAIYNKSTFKPQYMQLVTFNDHEEGTNLEWGIDSQLVCTGTGTAIGSIAFTLKGNVNTVDHIEVYVDNKLAGSITDMANPIFNLGDLSAGSHIVQGVVVGKPFFQQKVSNFMKPTVSYVSVPSVKYVWG